MAAERRRFSQAHIKRLDEVWKGTIQNCLAVFQPGECFRRLPLERPKVVINRALMDLTMTSLADCSEEEVRSISGEFRERYMSILANNEFLDLTTRAIDHKKRTRQRFELWHKKVLSGLLQ